jgi:hypothetical protein
LTDSQAIASSQSSPVSHRWNALPRKATTPQLNRTGNRQLNRAHTVAITQAKIHKPARDGVTTSPAGC